MIEDQSEKIALGRRPIIRRSAETGVRKGLDLSAMSRVMVSSEQAAFPIDNVFDDQRGPGGSCWMAADTGAQTVTIAFDAPERVSSIVVESEEHGGVRTQEIMIALSSDGGRAYVELESRTFTFKPYGPSFKSETWNVTLPAVTHLRVRILPTGAADRASLTSLVIH